MVKTESENGVLDFHGALNHPQCVDEILFPNSATCQSTLYTLVLIGFVAEFTRQQKLDTRHQVLDWVFVHPQMTANNFNPSTAQSTSGRGRVLRITEVCPANSYVAAIRLSASD